MAEYKAIVCIIVFSQYLYYTHFMKRKATDKNFLTKEEVEKIVEDKIKNRQTIDEIEPFIQKIMKNYPNRKDVEKIILDKLKNYPTHIIMDIKQEQMLIRIDEKARQYRDEVLTKMDQIVGELAQIREDRLFEKHEKGELKEQIDDHEKRIKN